LTSDIVFPVILTMRSSSQLLKNKPRADARSRHQMDQEMTFSSGDDDGVDEGLALTDLLITDDEVEKQPIAEPEEEGKSESDAMAISTTDAQSASGSISIVGNPALITASHAPIAPKATVSQTQQSSF
jgi:hypothetical protein